MDTNNTNDEIRNLQQFDSYIKHSLVNLVRTKKRQAYKIASREVSLEIMQTVHPELLAHHDTYCLHQQTLYPCGCRLIINNATLWSILSKLSPKQQDLVYLAYCEDLSDIQIATLFETTPNAIKKRRQRILKKMKKLASNEDHTYEEKPLARL